MLTGGSGVCVGGKCLSAKHKARGGGMLPTLVVQWNPS